MADQACLRMGAKGVPYRDCFCLMFGDQKVGHQKPQANSSLPVSPSVSLSIFSKPLRPSGLQASCILSSLHVSV